jgi:hypothetical protein
MGYHAASLDEHVSHEFWRRYDREMNVMNLAMQKKKKENAS